VTDVRCGTDAFFIRAGVKPLEFDKGKTAIAVASLDKLPAIIDTLIGAIRGGGCSAGAINKTADKAEAGTLKV
jgi:hypothetical protein